MTDVSELIERVARAICWAETAEGHDCSSKCLSASKCMADTMAPCFIRDARAAIEASGVQSLSERVAGLRSDLNQALDMIVDAARDGTYSVSEFNELKSALTKEGIENG